MPQDEIIKEVRAIREEYASRFDFDIQAIYRDAKAHEGEDQRKVVTLEPKRSGTSRSEDSPLGGRAEPRP